MSAILSLSNPAVESAAASTPSTKFNLIPTSEAAKIIWRLRSLEPLLPGQRLFSGYSVYELATGAADWLSTKDLTVEALCAAVQGQLSISRLELKFAYRGLEVEDVIRRHRLDVARLRHLDAAITPMLEKVAEGAVLRDVRRHLAYTGSGMNSAFLCAYFTSAQKIGAEICFHLRLSKKALAKPAAELRTEVGHQLVPNGAYGLHVNETAYGTSIRMLTPIGSIPVCNIHGAVRLTPVIDRFRLEEVRPTVCPASWNFQKSKQNPTPDRMFTFGRDASGKKLPQLVQRPSDMQLFDFLAQAVWTEMRTPVTVNA